MLGSLGCQPGLGCHLSPQGRLVGDAQQGLHPPLGVWGHQGWGELGSGSVPTLSCQVSSATHGCLVASSQGESSDCTLSACCILRAQRGSGGAQRPGRFWPGAVGGGSAGVSSVSPRPISPHSFPPANAAPPPRRAPGSAGCCAPPGATTRPPQALPGLHEMGHCPVWLWCRGHPTWPRHLGLMETSAGPLQRRGCSAQD